MRLILTWSRNVENIPWTFYLDFTLRRKAENWRTMKTTFIRYSPFLTISCRISWWYRFHPTYPDQDIESLLTTKKLFLKTTTVSSTKMKQKLRKTLIEKVSLNLKSLVLFQKTPQIWNANANCVKLAWENNFSSGRTNSLPSRKVYFRIPSFF